MKKLSFYLTILFLICLTSCNNFLKGSDSLKQINDTIDELNKPEVEVLIQSNQNWGNTLPAGRGYYKVDKKYSIIFTESDTYLFVRWEAVDNKTNTPLGEDKVYIEDVNSMDTYFTVKEEIKNVKIQPVCEVRPIINSCVPIEGSTNPRDEAIVITFTNNLSPDNDLSGIKVSCVGSSNLIGENYCTPQINGNQISIIPNLDNLLEVEEGKTLTLEVYIPDNLYYEKNDIKIPVGKEYRWTFKINNTTNDKAELSINAQSGIGSVTPVGSNLKYDIGKKINLTYAPEEGYTFINWKVAGNVDSIQIDDIQSTETVIEIKNKGAVTISPEVKFTPEIKKITPLDTNGGVNVDTKIEIQFNAALQENTVNNFKNIIISKYLPGEPQNKILLTSDSGEYDSKYFNNPVLSEDKKTITITVKGNNSIFEDNENTNKLYIEVEISENVKTVIEGNFAKVTHTYLVNQNKEKNVPEFYQMNLAKTETEAETGADSCFIKDKKLENFVEADFRRNHNKSFYFYCDVYDEESGVKSITIKESRVQDVDGNDIINPEVFTTTIDLNDDCFNVSGNGHVTISKEYSYQNTEDGIIKLEFYAEDYAGNESRKTYEYYVIKDTVISQNAMYITNEDGYIDNEYVYWVNPSYNGGGDVNNHCSTLYKTNDFNEQYKYFKVDGLTNDKWYKNYSDVINNEYNVKVYFGQKTSGIIRGSNYIKKTESFELPKELLEETSDLNNFLDDILIVVEVSDEVGNKQEKRFYMPNTIKYFLEDSQRENNILIGSVENKTESDIKLDCRYFVDYKWTDKLIEKYNSQENKNKRPYQQQIEKWYEMHNWKNPINIHNDATVIRIDKQYINYYEVDGQDEETQKLKPNKNDKQLESINTQIYFKDDFDAENKLYIDWDVNIIGKQINLSMPYEHELTGYLLPVYDYGDYKIYGRPYKKDFSYSKAEVTNNYDITFDYVEPRSLGPNTGMSEVEFKNVKVTQNGVDVTSDFNISYMCHFKNNAEIISEDCKFIIPSVTEEYNGTVGVIIKSKNGEQKFKKTENIIFNPLNNFPITSEHSYVVYNYDYTLRYRGNASFYIPLYQQMSNGTKYLCLFNLDPYNPTKLKNYDEDYYSFNLENASDDDYGEWEQTVDFYYCWIPCTTDDVELPNYPESYLDSFSKIKGVFDWIPVSKDSSFLTTLPDAFKSLKLYADSYDLQDGKYYLCVKIDDKLNEYLNCILDTDEYDESINNYMYKCLTYVDFTSVPRMYEFNNNKLVIPKIAFGDSGLQNKCHIVINQLNSSKWKFEPIVDKEISFNTLTNSFEESITLTATDTFYRVNVNAYTQRTKDVNDLKSKYDNTENEVIMSPFFIYGGDRTPKYFNTEENNNTFTVYSENPTLVQVISSNKENGYGNDIDSWERFGKEEYVTQAAGSTNNYYIDDMKNKIQYGQYYVIIVTTAHGERAISKVYKK